ncbi:hypothetical protein Sfulv_56320 [Streptomyces fulvorobeus]|uniref:Uncharacterized protein n=1 Tax=Streptomyces fulvorobeus TaxID=284028 RepID=A0A7J0CE79_9ACTN|nr:hypothetical protein Sfulv_56320 [Streptomyces fulvorobeus]
MNLRRGHREGRLGRGVVGEIVRRRFHGAGGRHEERIRRPDLKAEFTEALHEQRVLDGRVLAALEPGPALGADELGGLAGRCCSQSWLFHLWLRREHLDVIP